MLQNNFVIKDNSVSLEKDICLIFPFTVSNNAINSIGIDKDINSVPFEYIDEETDAVFSKVKNEFYKNFGYRTENENWIYLGEFKIPGVKGDIYSYAINITDIKSKKPEKNNKVLDLKKVSSLLEEGDLFINSSYLTLLKEIH